MKIIKIILLLPLFIYATPQRYHLTITESLQGKTKPITAHLSGIETINLKRCTSRLNLKKLYHKVGKKRFNNSLKNRVNRKIFKKNCHGENYNHPLFSPMIKALLNYKRPENLSRSFSEIIFQKKFHYTMRYTPILKTDQKQQYQIDLEIRQGSFQKSIKGGSGTITLTFDHEGKLLKQKSKLSVKTGKEIKEYLLIRKRIIQGKN